MAYIEKFEVDKEKLNYLIGLTSCGTCPIYKNCSRSLNASECYEKIERWIKPTKEYRVRARI